MRRFSWVLSTSVLLWSSWLCAEEPEATPDSGRVHMGGAFPWFPPFLRDNSHGARPHLAGPESPAEGYPHYTQHPAFYGIYHRPGAHAEECCGLECESGFAPRGVGFPYRQTPFRMDYHRYVVKRLPSMHGPSYYRNTYRPPVPACLQGCRHY